MAEKLYRDKDWLYEQYWVHDKSLSKMAKLAKCSKSVIGTWMRKFDIPRRTHAQGARLRSRDPIYREKLSMGMRRRAQDPEWRKKNIEAARRRHVNALYRNADWLYEMYWVLEKSMSELAVIARCDHETIRFWMRELNVPRRSQDKARRLMVQSSKWRRKHAEAMRLLARDPEWRRKYAEVQRRLALKKRGRGEMTDIEAICHTAFESLDLDFIFEKFIHPYRVDFFFPSHGVIVEAMGEYWHNRPEQREHDIERKAFLEASGYIVLEWWGPDIEADVWRLIDEELLPLLDQPSRLERPPHGVSKPYRGPHGWKSAIQLYLFGKEQDD